MRTEGVLGSPHQPKHETVHPYARFMFLHNITTKINKVPQQYLGLIHGLQWTRMHSSCSPLCSSRGTNLKSYSGHQSTMWKKVSNARKTRVCDTLISSKMPAMNMLRTMKRTMTKTRMTAMMLATQGPSSKLAWGKWCAIDCALSCSSRSSTCKWNNRKEGV